MRTFLFVSWLLFPFSAWAANEIELSNLTVRGTQASGQCGKGQVSIQGVSQSHATGQANVIAPDGRITVKSSKKTLVVGNTAPFFLQDRTMLSCLDTPRGKRLLVATFCNGSACELVEYQVIDPATSKIANQQSEEMCLRVCAEKTLGVAVPAHLRDGL